MIARLVRALGAEVALRPRALAIRLVSRGLPQFAFNRSRTAALRLFGVRIGPGSLVMGELELTGLGSTDLFSVGRNTMLSGPLYVDVGAPVLVGDQVHVGHHVALLTVTHEIGSSKKRCGPNKVAPIVIEDGAWIASGVTILPGVTIGRGAVVAAGAVVARNVRPDTLVAGVPATLVRDLEEEAPPAPSSSRSSAVVESSNG